MGRVTGAASPLGGQLPHSAKLVFALFLILLFAAAPVPYCQELTFSQSMESWVPALVDTTSNISWTIGTTSRFTWTPLETLPLDLTLQADLHSLTMQSNVALSYIGGAVGLGTSFPVSERLSAGFYGFAGLGQIPDVKMGSLAGQSYGLYEAGLTAELSIRLTAALSLSLSAGYRRLATPDLPFVDAPAGGISLKLLPGQLGAGKSGLRFEKIETRELFPVLRSWYDSQEFGRVTVVNDEEGPIENLELSFYAPEFMAGPRLCGTVDRIGPGESQEIPLYAVFDERVLALTENRKTTASIDVSYSFFGARRRAEKGVNIGFHHRNAMSWADDSRAAAFVSPNDPSALWFARYASSIVRNRVRTDLPVNIQYALGIFEGLRLHGVTYVIDPNSSYIELSENATAIDYLQYPSETLTYRGGDCDDLTILFCSLLESSGIRTGFITIPGHIYMALDTGISEEEAKQQFFDPGLLIFRDGRAWAPIEITMVKEGFVKAWRVGAKQWIDNDKAGTADFFPMSENWKTYRPSGLPGANPRFILPEESEMMVAFDEAVDRFIVRELGPVISDYESRLAAGDDPELRNEYGIVLAQAGMLDQAWEQFSLAAEAGFDWAWNNLASVAYIRKNYDLAQEYFQWAAELLPEDPAALLGVARSSYELDQYQEASAWYRRLAARDGEIAGRFSYLESVYGGEGRAWSMTDRLSTTLWSRPVKAADQVVSEALIAEAARAETTVAEAEIPQEPEAREDEALVDLGLPEEKEFIPQPEELVAVKEEPVEVEVPEEGSEELEEPEDPVEPEELEVAEELESAPEPEPQPEKAPEPVLVEEAPESPESVPEPIQEIVQEPEKLVQEPAHELVPEPAPVEEPGVARTEDAPAAEPEAAAIEEEDTVEEEQEEPPQEEPAPKRPAPPKIVEKAPEDAEIAQKASEAVRIASPEELEEELGEEVEEFPVAQEQFPDLLPPENQEKDEAVKETAPSTQESPMPAPPKIVEKAPEDAEIAQKASEAVRIAPPEELEEEIDEEPQEEMVIALAEPVEESAEAEEPEVPEPEPKDEPVEGLPKLIPGAEENVVVSVPEVVEIPVAALPAPVPPLPLPMIEEESGITGMANTTLKAEPETVEPLAGEITPAPESREISFLSSAVEIGNGDWSLTDRTAAMDDERAMYAKLVIREEIAPGPMAYEFTARSVGTHFVGFGIHIHGQGDWKLSYYGGGDSILIWITSDPKAYGDEQPRLQVYRSRDEVDMRLVDTVPIYGSAFVDRQYRVEYDPEPGVLRVLVDGRVELELDGLENDPRCDYLALRALDLARFNDLSVISLESEDE